jgi:HTH-type transcriptional regulator, competence development regulator
MNEACILRFMHKHRSRFGAHLRKLRVQRGIGLTKLAMTIGISPTYLSKIERGEMPPPAERQVVALAKVLGQDKDVFLGMAGRVASDLPAIIQKNPSKYAALVRALRKFRGADFDILFAALEPGGPIAVEFKRPGGSLEEAGRQIDEYKAMLSRIDCKPLVLSRTAAGAKASSGRIDLIISGDANKGGTSPLQSPGRGRKRRVRRS